jgi:hypothetical protein
VVMVMKISFESPSRQGARTEFLIPNRGFWWRRRSGSLSGKKRHLPDLKSSGGICRREGRPSGCLEPPHTGVARRGLGRATYVWRPLEPPLRLVFWLRGSSGEIGFFMIFPKFLLEVEFLHKNETPEQFCWK